MGIHKSCDTVPLIVTLQQWNRFCHTGWKIANILGKKYRKIKSLPQKNVKLLANVQIFGKTVCAQLWIKASKGKKSMVSYFNFYLKIVLVRWVKINEKIFSRLPVWWNNFGPSSEHKFDQLLDVQPLPSILDLGFHAV